MKVFARFGIVALLAMGAGSSAFGQQADPSYWELIQSSYRDYWNYILGEITFNYDYKPIWWNFFYWLIFISILFFVLEVALPWRKQQPKLRRDFWLDVFYMFFNVFLFGLLVFSALENVFTKAFGDFLGLFGVDNLVAVQIDKLPVWAYYVVLFLVADFIQWNVHRLLHRVPWLWEFHKVHHSVEQMGFAAHLRFHWMESVVYKLLQALPLTMLGYNLVDLYVLHMFNMAWGHFNHANITVHPRVTGLVFGSLAGFGLGALYAGGEALGMAAFVLSGAAGGFLVFGPYMRYVFNSPEMHIWHHAKEMPDGHRYGINFGLTLAIWDYLFGTAHVPHSGRDIPLGFEDMESFPRGFLGQVTHGLNPFRRR